MRLAGLKPQTEAGRLCVGMSIAVAVLALAIFAMTIIRIPGCDLEFERSCIVAGFDIFQMLDVLGYAVGFGAILGGPILVLGALITALICLFRRSW